MTIPHISPLAAFLLTWCILALGLGAVLDRVRTPYVKLLLIRVAGFLGGALLVAGVWYFSGTSQDIYFGIGGMIAVSALNFFCVRVCPHCARTAWPRYELALGLCPRCGTDMSRAHERVASWQRTV